MRVITVGLFLIGLGATIGYATAQSSVPCMAKLDSVAKRLRVTPATTNSMFNATACSGRQYDLVALVEAFLDRLDKVEKRI